MIDTWVGPGVVRLRQAWVKVLTVVGWTERMS
jgi:hypothetical protein